MKIINFLETVAGLGLVFHRNSWAIWNQNSYETEVRMGMIICTNEFGHMTNMATMPIYGKNRKKSSSTEAIA